MLARENAIELSIDLKQNVLNHIRPAGPFYEILCSTNFSSRNFFCLSIWIFVVKNGINN